MKKLFANSLAAALVLMALAAFTMDPHAVNPFKVAESSKMVIKGTSSVHDWETEVTVIHGTGSFSVKDGKIEGANNVQITIPVKSIKSGKSGMDNKTYEALKASQAPNIHFALTHIRSSDNGKIVADGNLTIAGTTKPVTITGKYELLGSQIVISGTHELNMKNFNIDPPTAMLGAIKAGADISIDYTLVFLSE